jgi:hypothetical protein
VQLPRRYNRPISMTLQVKCRCGAVTLELEGAPIAQFFCHCDDCQALHGGAYAPESLYAAERVKVVEGTPSRWTLKRNPRHLCATCGTRLFIDVLAFGLRGVNGYMLPPSEFTPSFHMFCRYAVRPVVDELPHYAALPARFGGSDTTVAW